MNLLKSIDWAELHPSPESFNSLRQSARLTRFAVARAITQLSADVPLSYKIKDALVELQQAIEAIEGD